METNISEHVLCVLWSAWCEFYHFILRLPPKEAHPGRLLGKCWPRTQPHPHSMLLLKKKMLPCFSRSWAKWETQHPCEDMSCLCGDPADPETEGLWGDNRGTASGHMDRSAVSEQGAALAISKPLSPMPAP